MNFTFALNILIFIVKKSCLASFDSLGKSFLLLPTFMYDQVYSKKSQNIKKYKKCQNIISKKFKLFNRIK